MIKILLNDINKNFPKIFAEIRKYDFRRDRLSMMNLIVI